VEGFRVFTDPANPGIEIPIRLRVRKSVSKDFALQAKVRGLMQDYITGRDGGPAGKFIVNGERVEVTPQLCSTAAILSTYEVPDEGEAAYTPLDWFGLSETMPSLMEEVLEMYVDLEQQAKVQAKNS